jgi:folate-binding protein YgfZ
VSTDHVSPLVKTPGAVEATGADTGVAAHYGDPVREQRLLAAGKAVVDLSHHGLLSITGPDRLSWIDSITSQSVAELQPGQSSETLILDPNGRIEHAVRLIDDGETLWVLVERSEAAPLLAWLLRMRFMMRVELADRGAEFAVLGAFASAGDLGLPVAAPHGVALEWCDPWAAVTPGGWQYAVGEHPGVDFDYREIVVPRDALPVLGDVPLAGTLALEALRIAAWRPRFATEVDEKSIPHELDWLRSAVHLSKGCYRGQETVAKVHNLGHPPRRLVMLHLDGSDATLPAPGDPVVTPGPDGEDRQVGSVTSVARHHELGPIALAVVKRTTDPLVTLVVLSDGLRVAAGQDVIVPPGAGAEANVPRLPRLGAVTRPPRPVG